MMNIVDYDEDAIVLIPFSTNAQDGGTVGPSDSFEVDDFVIYQDTFNTGKETTDGMAVVTNWAGITGLHMLLINTAVDTGNVDFSWAAGSIYTVCIRPDETVDGKTVRNWVGCFRLGYVALAMKNAIVAQTAAELSGADLTILAAFSGGELTIHEGAEYSVAQGNYQDLDASSLPDMTGGEARLRIYRPKGTPIIDVVLSVINAGQPNQKIRFALDSTESVKVNPPEILSGTIIYKVSGASSYAPFRVFSVPTRRL